MENWVAFAGLLFTILTVSGGGLWALMSKMNTIKESNDREVETIRLAAFLEYKELRREMNEGWGKAYLEFGEAPKAIREKLSQVELFMRDTYVPLKLYERGQDQVLEAIKALATQSEKRFESLDKKIDNFVSETHQRKL